MYIYVLTGSCQEALLGYLGPFGVFDTPVYSWEKLT